MTIPSNFTLIEVKLRDDSIFVITMKNGKVNALGKEHLTELREAFEYASKADAVKGILLRSSKEKVYCAGLDLMQVGSFTMSEDAVKLFGDFIFNFLGPSCASMLTCPKPVATVVNGHCLAGGLVLALCADYLCYGPNEKAKVGLTELAVPVPFPHLPVAIVRNRVGPFAARKIIFDAVTLSPSEMFKLGVGDAIDNDPETNAINWLSKKISMGIKPFAITKDLWWGPTLRDLPDLEAQLKWTEETIDAIQSRSKL